MPGCELMTGSSKSNCAQSSIAALTTSGKNCNTRRKMCFWLCARETPSWHFQYSLTRQNLWVLATSIDSRLIAYAIFDRQDNRVLGLKRVRLVDFQSLNGGEKLIGPALGWMFQRCREEGIHVLEYAGCWPGPGLPRISAPYNAVFKLVDPLLQSQSQRFKRHVRRSEKWTPSLFDGDASL